MPPVIKRSNLLPQSVRGCRWIPLTQNQFALIDKIDYDKVNKFYWYALKCKNDKFYALRTFDDKLMHRFLLDLNDRKLTIDHKDGNSLNNRRNNLRICSQGENSKNRSKQYNNKSGYKGVYWDKIANKWRANISIDNKTKYIGLFDDIVEAAKAYDIVAIENYGEFAKLNFGKQLIRKSER